MAIASIIQVLVANDVEFIVVGGMAAVLQGAPVHTIDLDIVYALSESNIARLELALTELGAIFRDDPRRLVPNRTHLQSRGHKLLQTSGGPLDVLATIETNTTFEDLLPDSDLLEVDGARFRVLSLARLIVVKEKLNRTKDQAMLVLLRATLDELQKRRP
jgi:predicted nucleotidyltransferase